jgi:hypothetical protein
VWLAYQTVPTGPAERRRTRPEGLRVPESD